MLLHGVARLMMLCDLCTTSRLSWWMFFCLGRLMRTKLVLYLQNCGRPKSKRIILSKRNLFKEFNQRGIKIVSDEPTEVRRKQTFERLKY